MITKNSNAIFTDVWESSADFITDYRNSDLNKATFTDASLKVLFAQLYAKHGSDHIRYSDKQQWEYAVFSIIYNKGIKWQVALAKQAELETLTEDEISYGGRVVTNATQNPSTADQGMTEDDGLPTIDVQNATINRMNKVVAYSGYLSSLKDVTTEFINEFDKLFALCVSNPGSVYYRNEEEEED